MEREEEIIKLLKEIRSLLVYALSEEYVNRQDMKQFCINIAANIFVEAMENDKGFKEKIMNNFKKQGL